MKARIREFDPGYDIGATCPSGASGSMGNGELPKASTPTVHQPEKPSTPSADDAYPSDVPK